MGNHGPFGTELLTTKATDALVAVDVRKVVFHGNGLGRTDLEAFLATDAVFRKNLRTGTQGFCGDKVHCLYSDISTFIGEKFDVFQLFDILKIRERQGVPGNVLNGFRR